jgi:hypothetical protein
MEFDLRFTVPGGLGNGVPEAFEEGVAKAARLFFKSDNLRRLDVSADQIAAIIVGPARPPSRILEDGERLSTEDINLLQSVQPKTKRP